MATIYSNTFCNNTLSSNALNPFVKDEGNVYKINRSITEDEIIAAAKALLATRLARELRIPDPKTCRDFLITQMGKYENEVFCVVFLDSQNRIIAIEEMFTGTINQSSVYPREVVKQALKHNAASVILAHNHPSGHPKASQADIAITKLLTQVLQLIEVRVLDHIIIAGGSSLSLVEEGVI